MNVSIQQDKGFGSFQFSWQKSEYASGPITKSAQAGDFSVEVTANSGPGDCVTVILKRDGVVLDGHGGNDMQPNSSFNAGGRLNTGGAIGVAVAWGGSSGSGAGVFDFEKNDGPKPPK